MRRPIIIASLAFLIVHMRPWRLSIGKLVRRDAELKNLSTFWRRRVSSGCNELVTRNYPICDATQGHTMPRYSRLGSELSIDKQE
ncbi:hypothetical protein B0H63DRAFT_159194 [Podospora didyma]|uniref:Secreted protein n=1 Tax=Podospora didyma TaxID=330526 RepID=A0AAE0NTQ7_9PEZI|nr:hypothetical protein B0H63DRAFT_159194 [Podospora didyma]